MTQKFGIPHPSEIPKDAIHPTLFGPILAPALNINRLVQESVEPWVDRRFINLARRVDNWAQDGPRAAYPARRKLAFSLRKAVRES